MPLLDEVRTLTPTIRSLADEVERERGVPETVICSLADMGVFRIAAGTPDPATMVDVFEEIGFADGSTGWCAMIGGATSMVLNYLPEAVAGEMLADPRMLIAGVAAPQGKGVVDGGGLRVTGRWAFASASRHATWLVGGVIVPELKAMRLAVMPAKDVTIIDTWDAQGLRGTGSHDFAADNLLVPAERVFGLVPRESVLPPLSLLALGIGAVSLGIARAAIEAFTQLTNDRNKADRGWARAAVAESESLRASALSYLRTTSARGGNTPTDRAAQRLAVTTAARNAARAVDLVYDAAGGAAVYAKNPLQRHFRDVHTATQHANVGPDILDTIGAVLLGADVDTTRL